MLAKCAVSPVDTQSHSRKISRIKSVSLEYTDSEFFQSLNGAGVMFIHDQVFFYPKGEGE